MPGNPDILVPGSEAYGVFTAGTHSSYLLHKLLFFAPVYVWSEACVKILDSQCLRMVRWLLIKMKNKTRIMTTINAHVPPCLPPCLPPRLPSFPLSLSALVPPLQASR